MEEKKGLYGSTLKIIAIVTMLIDHIGATLVENTMYASGYMEAMNDAASITRWMMVPLNRNLYLIDNVMRLIGRLGFPLFAFLLVQGFTHTHNRLKYVLRMALFCIIAEVPFNLAIGCTVSNPYFQSVFFTLTIGILVLWGMETLKNREYNDVLSNILKYVSFFMFGWFFFYMFIQTILGNILYAIIPLGIVTMEINPFGLSIYVPNLRFALIGCIFGIVSLIIFMFATRKKEKNAVIAEAMSWFPVYAGLIVADLLMTDYAAMGVLTIVLMYLFRNKKVKSMVLGCLTLTLYSPIEFTAFLDAILVKKYNGERGLKIKYFFYIFYPAHLLILYLIGHFALGVM